MSVFVDTSALYALMFPEDAHYHEAVECVEGFHAAGSILVSSNYVLLECASLLQRRHSFELAKTFLDKATNMLDVVWIGEQEHRQAVALWSKAARRKLSLVDCASVVTMHRRSIRRIVAFDAHFVEAGFEMLPRADRVAERRGPYRAKSLSKRSAR